MSIYVNDKAVPDEWLQQELNRIKQQGPDLDEVKAFEQARDLVVERLLLENQAEKMAAEPDAIEVEKQLAQQKTEVGGEAEFYRLSGYTRETEDQYKSLLKTKMWVQALFELWTQDLKEPEEEELKAYYDNHKTKLRSVEKVEVRHIVSRLQGQEDLSLYDMMRSIRKKVQSGQELNETQVPASEGQRTTFRDLGEIKKGEMVPEFESVVFSMGPGELSPVFLSQYGYHLAKTGKKTPAQQMAYKEARDLIFKQILQDKRNEVIQQNLTALKESAKIEEK